jgi:ornithine cyclodeaminase
MPSHVPLIDAAGIDAVLPMAECIELMHEALRSLDAGEAVQPLRTVIHLPDGSGSLYTMPAFSASPRALAVKLISVFHGNDAKDLPSHQGLVVVFDVATGAPAALIDAARLTAVRTAAVSAVATRALAVPDASRLAILGAGVQARSHIAAMLAVRPFRTVRVWSRTPERATRLADSMRGDVAAELMACTSAREAVIDADVICTVTSSPERVLEGAWLREGAHINAVGASTANTREIDSDAAARAHIFIDSIEGASHEAGDLLIPLREGRIAGPATWTTLGSVVSGRAAGRTRDRDITLFKSLGLAVEDAAAASVVARRVGG